MAFESFRYRMATSQAVSAGVETTMLFDTLDHESQSGVINPSTGQLTIPAAWNGLYMTLSAGVVWTANSAGNFYLRKSVDGGSNWTQLGNYAVNFGGNAGHCQLGPLALVTGDMYDFTAKPGGSVTVWNAASPPYYAVNFIGGVIGAATDNFSLSVATNQVLTVGSDNEVTWGTTQFDTSGATASNRYTVPSSHNGKYGFFSIQLWLTTAQQHRTYLERSQDGGTTWVKMADMGKNRVAIDSANFRSGPIPLTTGDIFRVNIVPDGATNIDSTQINLFAGMII